MTLEYLTGSREVVDLYPLFSSAPIGIPLAMLGSVTSAAGGGIQAGLQFADGNVSGGLGTASMSALSLIPGSRLIPSKTLGHHILNQGASLKISGINRLLNE